MTKMEQQPAKLIKAQLQEEKQRRQDAHLTNLKAGIVKPTRCMPKVERQPDWDDQPRLDDVNHVNITEHTSRMEKYDKFSSVTSLHSPLHLT
jgi:hypothetical protein